MLLAFRVNQYPPPVHLMSSLVVESLESVQGEKRRVMVGPNMAYGDRGVDRLVPPKVINHRILAHQKGHIRVKTKNDFWKAKIHEKISRKLAKVCFC
jgi:hypothetical protein